MKTESSHHPGSAALQRLRIPAVPLNRPTHLSRRTSLAIDTNHFIRHGGREDRMGCGTRTQKSEVARRMPSHRPSPYRGGGKGTRTPGLNAASVALSQLSYTPEAASDYSRSSVSVQPAEVPTSSTGSGLPRHLLEKARAPSIAAARSPNFVPNFSSREATPPGSPTHSATPLNTSASETSSSAADSTSHRPATATRRSRLCLTYPKSTDRHEAQRRPCQAGVAAAPSWSPAVRPAHERPRYHAGHNGRSNHSEGRRHHHAPSRRRQVTPCPDGLDEVHTCKGGEADARRDRADGHAPVAETEASPKPVTAPHESTHDQCETHYLRDEQGHEPTDRLVGLPQKAHQGLDPIPDKPDGRYEHPARVRGRRPPEQPVAARGSQRHLSITPHRRPLLAPAGAFVRPSWLERPL
jgi:hypothetical protein